MTRSGRLRRIPRALGATAAIAAVVAVGPLRPAAAESGVEAQVPEELVLTGQSAVVAPGGAFTTSVLVDGVRGATSLRIVVHDRARSRSELAGANGGTATRGAIRTLTQPIQALAAAADGSRQAVLPLVLRGQKTIGEPGVYPVDVQALDADGGVLDQLVTDLVVRPAANDRTPPLSVAVVAEVGTDAQRRPSDEAALATAGALTAVPDVAATLAASPSLLDDLAASTEPADAALLDALRAAAAGHPVLALPYVATSPDALASVGLGDELGHQMDHGAEVTRSALGVSADQAAWLAGPDLGAAGLRALSALGIRAVSVEPGRVERVVDGVLTPARPFELAPPEEDGARAAPDRAVSALLTDGRLAEVLLADEEPALVAAHVTAELAMLWFEQPGTARSILVPVPGAVAGAALQQLLVALRTPELFRPVSVDAAFEAAAPLEGSGGRPLSRALVPAELDALPDTLSAAVRGLRSARASVVEAVGQDHPTLAALDRHLLRATGLGLDGAARSREVSQGRSAIAALADAVSTPDQVTITLTARTGTVPLTIRNDTGGPVQVRLRFSSAKLELPDGETRLITLTDQTTRLDVRVRTRTSGSFPFAVDVTSPDGAVELASTSYSVRSTAVSGVGLVLSIGAGLFLIVWWARHWRESRRSTKLVQSNHPTLPGV